MTLTIFQNVLYWYLLGSIVSGLGSWVLGNKATQKRSVCAGNTCREVCPLHSLQRIFMHALELPLESCLFSPIYWYEVVYFIFWLYLFYTTLFFKLFQLWTFEVIWIDFCIYFCYYASSPPLSVKNFFLSRFYVLGSLCLFPAPVLGSSTSLRISYFFLPANSIRNQHQGVEGVGSPCSTGFCCFWSLLLGGIRVYQLLTLALCCGSLWPPSLASE